MARVVIIGQRYEDGSLEGRKLLRGVDRQLYLKQQKERAKHPDGHRNMTKAQRRALGLIGAPGRGTPRPGMPWLKS